MFYVMDFLDGRIFWDPALPEAVDNDERAAIYDAMNATLAALHDVDVEAAGLADFGRPGNYFERQLARWTSQYRASETGTIADMDRLIAWLETHMPADDGRVSLVHGDYRLDNLIFAPDQPKVIAVLDWELSTLGHPFADIAYQCMQWRLPHASGFRGLGGIDRAALGLPSEEDYVAAYCRRRGLDGIGNWTFFLAFSFFRLAAICQGVYKRALDGNASNPEKARTYGEAVKLLSHLAAETDREGRLGGMMGRFDGATVLITGADRRARPGCRERLCRRGRAAGAVGHRRKGARRSRRDAAGRNGDPGRQHRGRETVGGSGQAGGRKIRPAGCRHQQCRHRAEFRAPAAGAVGRGPPRA